MRIFLVLCLLLFATSARAATITITTTAQQDKGVVFVTNLYNDAHGTSFTPVQYATRAINAMLDQWVQTAVATNVAGIKPLFENASDAQKCAAVEALGQTAAQASILVGATCQ